MRQQHACQWRQRVAALIMKKIPRESLQGLRVLNTRPLDQAGPLNALIHAAKGQALSCPMLEIIPSNNDWLTNLPNLLNVTHAIFTSPNAVIHSVQAICHQWPKTITVTAIGQATASLLRENGILVHYVPDTADSEHLLALTIFQEINNQTILLFKGHNGRTLIADTLTSRGANVIELPVYHRILPSINQKQLTTWWQENAVDIILFTSHEAMQNLFIVFNEKAHDWLRQLPCLVISKRLANAALNLGMREVNVCSYDEIVDKLLQLTKGLTYGNDNR